jgi:shikimate dehydrogenase
MADFLPALTGCFARPVAENPTVLMMEAAFRHHGLHCRYINMEVAPDSLADAVRGAKAQGYIGFNCSLPHKIAVIPHLDRLTPSAALIGAVNTAIRQPDGTWLGENTDGKGFLESLREIIDPAGRHLLVFGAGGAARAIAVELALAGAARLTIVNRSAPPAEALVSLVNAHGPAAFVPLPPDRPFALPEDVDIVVNATSVGLFPDVADAIPATGFLPHMIVADVIPNPPRTAFLAAAAHAGCRTLDGLGMLVNQGALNIAAWLGVTPDRSIMRAALAAHFSSHPD